MCRSLPGCHTTPPPPPRPQWEQSKHTNKHMHTLLISRSTSTVTCDPGKTFPDSWPQRLEGWPRFSPSHFFFFLTCSQMLISIREDIHHFSPCRSLTYPCYTLIQLRFGKWISNFKEFLWNLRILTVLSYCGCCKDWSPWRERKKKPNSFLISERWKWRRLIDRQADASLFISVFYYLFIFNQNCKNLRQVLGKW